MFVLPASATADSSNGGAGIQVPVVKQLICDDGQVTKCARQQLLTIRGDLLKGAKSVTFLGRSGSRDDRRAPLISSNSRSIVVRIPAKANSGKLRVVVKAGSVESARIKLTRADMVSKAGLSTYFVGGPAVRFDYTAAEGNTIELVRVRDQEAVRSWPADPGADGQGSVKWDGRIGGTDAPVGRYGFRIAPRDSAPGRITSEFSLYDHIFPIRGAHKLSGGPATRFGGGRGHQGQDVFASCGTRLVVARGGTVIKRAYHGRAGNYVVIQRTDGRSYAYMHLKKRSPLAEGERVATGDFLGQVGDTGRASGCHLHFEIWTAPGWYKGGKPIDPLPSLKLWDEWS